jgi:splicing factor 3B subunit 5
MASSSTSNENTTADRFNVNLTLSRNWEYLRSRYVGTGNPDTTREEWMTQIQRDTLASGVGHFDQLSYFALAGNQSVERTRMDMLNKMIRPIPRPTEEEKH